MLHHVDRVFVAADKVLTNAITQDQTGLVTAIDKLPQAL